MYIFIKGEVFFWRKIYEKNNNDVIFLIFVVSCGQSEAPSGNDVTFDVIGVQLYNEFIPCVGGQTSIKKMSIK